jgi:hypothetical protein
MKKKTYKYLVDCKITVVAKDAEEARKLIKEQLSISQCSEGDYYEGSLVEEYSKYNKLGRARRVKFYEGDNNGKRKT